MQFLISFKKRKLNDFKFGANVFSLMLNMLILGMSADIFNEESVI